MTDTTNGPDASGASDASTDDPLEAVDRVGERIERALMQMPGGFGAASVFSPPEHVGDRVIITAASVQRAGGFGFGAGGGGEGESEGSGGGGGGGGNAEGRPVAVIEVTPSGVNVRPVLDFTKLGIVLVTSILAVWRLSLRRLSLPRNK